MSHRVNDELTDKQRDDLDEIRLERRINRSECCDAPMIGGVQCENCGSDGRNHER